MNMMLDLKKCCKHSDVFKGAVEEASLAREETKKMLLAKAD